jgi:hypothetical protein
LPEIDNVRFKTSKTRRKIGEISTERFLPHLKNSGGLFTSIRRSRLLGLTSKRKLKNDIDLANDSDFWFDIRRSVKSGLIDLELFLQVAEPEQINQVFNEKSVEPVLATLFWGQALNKPPDKVTASLAHLAIKYGFMYL